MSADAETECDKPNESQDGSAALVLDELTRQIDRQAVDISNARSRAIGLISAAGVVNGVFGFSGIANGVNQLGLRPLTILALAAFALMVISLLPTLIPRKFDLRGDLIHHMVRLSDGISTRRLDVAISIATGFDQMIRRNAPKIDGLYWCLTAASVLLATQVLLWAAGIVF